MKNYHLGASGPDVIKYWQRKQLKSQLIISHNILDPTGTVLHKKEDPVPSNIRVKKWGESTVYELKIDKEIVKPVKLLMQVQHQTWESTFNPVCKVC